MVKILKKMKFGEFLFLLYKALNVCTVIKYYTEI